jgi:hypothetical protein
LQRSHCIITTAMSEKKKIIGFYGCPPREIVNSVRMNHPDSEWIDLDVDFNAPDSGVLPVAYCRILRNIVDNAIAKRDNIDLIIAAVGSDKCDGGHYASYLLEQMGFKVIKVRNEKIDANVRPERIHVPISQSGLPLDLKVDRIMKTALVDNHEKWEYIKPTHGFWGVPPNDFEILKLFPYTTHVFGWTRCVEAGRPADLELECYVEPNLPTVFFTQSFCAKAQLAKYLAEKHDGIFIDADGKINNGVIARIEAFLELNG